MPDMTNPGPYDPQAYRPPITPPQHPALPPQPEYGGFPPPPAPPKKKHTVRNVLLIIVAAFVALCGVGTIVAATTSSGKTGNTAATVHTSSAKPAASPTAAAAAAPVSPAPAQLTITQQMRAWFDQGGQDHLTALSNAMGEVQRTTQAGDVQGAKQAALGLGVAVKSAQSYAPLPDPTAQKYWSSALSHFGKCAQSMYVGLTAVDSGSLADAITEMDAGAEQLRLTTQRTTKLLQG